MEENFDCTMFASYSVLLDEWLLLRLMERVCKPSNPLQAVSAVVYTSCAVKAATPKIH